MWVRPTIDFDQSVEDRAACKTLPLHVFDVDVQLAVSLPDAHFQMWIAKTEGRQGAVGRLAYEYGRRWTRATRHDP
jgi:hypothetical protein